MPPIKKSLTLLIPFVLTLVLLLSAAGPAIAKQDTPAPLHPAGPTDPAELESFLNDLLGKELKDNHIAGATISVVKDGKLFFAKGYGYADVEKSIPVDPEQTVFRVGSVTKLFTWTAVMQLVEQGKLDLDADINTYLDFHIPDTYPQPITLKHVLTHTAGFEDRFNEVLASDAAHEMPVREWLVSHMPARVRPPGDCAAYSNYGTALAGYIVSRITGKPYEQAIQETILGPLGMLHSSLLAPMPPDLQAHASNGYTFVDGALKAFPDYLGQPAMAPAGGLQSTAADMAHFMIAHLDGGSYSDASVAEGRILKQATAQQMQSTLYAPDPRISGTAYGFFDFSDNGQRTLGHSGESYPFNTLLLLLPDQDLGVFVSWNSQGGGDLTLQHLGFQRAFFDHYYPAPPATPIQPAADFAARAGRFEGAYKLARSSYTTLEKVSVLMGSTVEIRAAGEGGLVLKSPWGDWRFIETAPLYFRQADGTFSLLFQEDGRGRITRMFTSITPQFAFDRLSWYETPAFNMVLLLACLLIFLSMIVAASIRLIRNRRLGADWQVGPRGARIAQWIILAICVLDVLFVVGTVLWGNPTPLFGVPLIYRIVLGLGVLSAVLTAAALVYAALAWQNRYLCSAARIHYAITTLAAVAFVWFLNSWNLLGWRF